MIVLLVRLPPGGNQWKKKHDVRGSNHTVAAKAPKSIYEHFKRTKQWFFKWLRSHQSGDPYCFRSKSRAPLRRPFQIDET